MPNTNNDPAAVAADDPRILLTPLKPALIHGVAQKVPLLVRLQAPDAPAASAKERLPYHLALVIDRSGSMSGEPLAEAVRCARHIVDRLQSSDVASLVVFDHRVDVLAGVLCLLGERRRSRQRSARQERSDTSRQPGSAVGAAPNHNAGGC